MGGTWPTASYVSLKWHTVPVPHLTEKMNGIVNLINIVWFVHD